MFWQEIDGNSHEILPNYRKRNRADRSHTQIGLSPRAMLLNALQKRKERKEMAHENAAEAIRASRTNRKYSANKPSYSEVDLAHTQALLQDRIYDLTVMDCPIDSGIRLGLAAGIGIIEQLRLNRRLSDM